MFYHDKKHIDEVQLNVNVIQNVAVRPRLEKMRFLEPAVEAKMYDMLYKFGPGNGTALFMPFDQKSSEHGPGHEFGWEHTDQSQYKGCADMRAIAELVNRGNFSGYVLHPGNARKYKHLFRPDIPLIYKINGHISQPNVAGISSRVGCVKDALKLGAHAIGLTIYPGGTHIEKDMENAARIIREAHDAGLAAVVWSYARGVGLTSPILLKDEQGEFEGMAPADSLYWTHYAVSIASGFLGADIVKTKYPNVVTPEKRRGYFTYIDKLAKKNPTMTAYKYFEPKGESQLTQEQEVFRAQQIVQAAPHSIVIFSGGPKQSSDPTNSLRKQTDIIMRAGAEGGIYGRKLWGLPIDRGLQAMNATLDVIRKPEFHRLLKGRRFGI